MTAYPQMLPNGKKTGYVYFILSQGGFIKIGWSFSPLRRMYQLQAGTPFPLSLFHIIESPTPQRLEYHFHKKFAKFRFRGEWYKAHPIIDYMAELVDDNGYVRFEVKPRFKKIWTYKGICGENLYVSPW